jgi:hypothetical protein
MAIFMPGLNVVVEIRGRVSHGQRAHDLAHEDEDEACADAEG